MFMGLTIVDYKLNFSPDRPADKLHARVSKRLANCCERNGGLYIKLGQAIAIQAALLPLVYTQALASIFDAAWPMPFRHVHQVHRATLKGSATPVAVKVQRPNIPIQIELSAPPTLLHPTHTSFFVETCLPTAACCTSTRKSSTCPCTPLPSKQSFE
ncbi:hypothetical protein PtB15_11B557 [Puccinia triticina]|nr:hypothetical protein PtB15_11B557 [Puccinia triticina]